MRRTVVSLLAGALAVAGLSLAQPARAADAWLGVYTQEITPELRDGMNYNGAGALVRRVVPDSPADRAGIERGDVIVRVGSHGIDSPEELANVVRGSDADAPVDVIVVRDGAKRSLRVTLSSHEQSSQGDEFDVPTPPPSPRMRHREPEAPEAREAPDTPEAPEAPEAPETPSPERMRMFMNHGNDGQGRDMMLHLPDMLGPGMSGRGQLGVRIESLNPDLASYFGSRDARGALVLDVIDDSPARKAGIRAGDVITRVDSKPIENADDLIEAVRSSEGRVSISVLRHGARQTIETTLDKSPQIMRYQRSPRSFSWKSGDGKNWKMQGLDDNGRMKRIIINGDEPDAQVAPRPRDRESMDAMREQLRQMREELRQMREELHNK